MFKIFRVDPATKRPMVKAWDRLAAEREQGDWPAYGIPTGAINGIVVLDVDSRSGGVHSWERLRMTYRLPSTYTVRTGGEGGEGRHYYYKLPIADLRGRKLKSYGFEGIDMQANGQYVIGPGSLHPSGNKYVIVSDEPIAELPAEFVAILTQVMKVPTEEDILPEAEWPTYEKRVERAKKYIRAMPPAISGQDGHGTTLKAALLLVRGFGLRPGSALAILQTFYNPVCMPRWSDQELQHKVDSACQSVKVPMGYMLRKEPTAPDKFDLLLEEKSIG